MGAEVFSIAAPDWWHMLMMIGALERVIACGMTVHAPRMRQQFSDLNKNRARALCLVPDRFKFRRTFEGQGLRLSLRKCGSRHGGRAAA